MQLKVSLNPAWRRRLAPADRRFWFLRSLAFHIEVRANPLWVVELYWKRLLLAAAVSLLAGYFGAVTALWGWWHQYPQSQIRWGDVALAPVRWNQLEQRRGDTAIALGLENLRQHDFMDGYYRLRVGLLRSPGNTTGRLILARILAVQEPAQSLAMLEDGLHFTPGDLDLLHTLFATYASQQAGERALQKAEQLLAPGYRPALSPEARFFLGMVRSGLLAEAGRLPETDHALGDVQALANSPENLAAWNRLKIDLLIRRGQVAEAQAWVQEHIAEGSRQPDELRLRAEVALAAGDEATLSLSLRRLKAATQDAVGAHLYAIRAWHRAKLPTRLLAEENEYLMLFGGDDGALQALAALAVSLQRPETIRHVVATAAQSRLNTFAFQVHLTELALRQGDTDEAFRRLREWEAKLETLRPEQRFYPQLVSRLVRACTRGDDGQAQPLLTLLADGRGQAQSTAYLLVVESLERSGKLPLAKQAATTGLGLYPGCDTLLAANERLTHSLAVASAAAAPPVPTLQLPATAEETFRLIDEALATDSPLRAREWLRAVREARPPWAKQQAAALALRELTLEVLTTDAFSSRGRVLGYLELFHDAADLLPLVTLAREQLARGHMAEARMIHDALAGRTSLPDSIRRANEALALPDDLAALATSAAVALTALDDRMTRGNYSEAEQLWTYLREKNPAWLAASRIELAVREVRLRFALDQRPQALAAFKGLVVASGASRSAAFRLVRDLRAHGEPENARLLAQETVRLLGDDSAAAKLRQETEAPLPPAP